MRLFRFSVALCLCILPAAAQEFRATLQGTITDPSQAGVPDASVTLRNADTGIERQEKTDSAGHYIFTFVVPGKYW